MFLRRIARLPDVSGVGRWLPLLAVAAGLALATPARALDPSWPRQFESSSGSFVIYQPQPEDLNGDLLSCRAAFSLERTTDAQPTFGVLWFTEHIEIDRDSSTVVGRDLDVLKVRLPGITAAEASRYEGFVEAEARGWDLSGSLEDLKAGLASTERERASVADLDNAPPRIRFVNERAILVLYDGPPVLEPIEGSDLQRVANTPYAVTFDPGLRSYYLSGANAWYRADDPLGPWTSIPNPPREVRAVVPPDTSVVDALSGAPPRVITATEPTELISIDGRPQYASLVGDELLYVTNTESDVLRLVSTQAIYVLLAGRWFRAPSPDGPWTFVRGDQLPTVFRRVPADSPKGEVLASVPGTDQADDAVADAEIPQTSAIRRDESGFRVLYDGPASFEPIAGTEMRYAVNTDAEVIFADGRYYACDQGVWYIADDPDGPWRVSDTRPLAVDDIPPSCPVYDVRYVSIYDATPTYVYVGYLPGYLGCYPYYGTVVYGTGYRYRPWRGRRHFYPRPCTWGFHARYNPWLGRWSFGSSYGVSFLRIGFRWHRASIGPNPASPPRWFGAGGYRRPILGPDLAPARTRGAGRTPRLGDTAPMNLYKRPENVVRVNREASRMPLLPIARPRAGGEQKPNNVFAGSDGRVYQRDESGKWKVNEGRDWRPAQIPQPAPVQPQSTGGNGRNARPGFDWPRARPLPPPAPAQPMPAPPSDRRNEPRPVPPTNPPARPERTPFNPPPVNRTPPTSNPAPTPVRPVFRPEPPVIRPVPGDLNREFHGRERGSAPPAPARPAAPPEKKSEKKNEEPERRKSSR